MDDIKIMRTYNFTLTGRGQKSVTGVLTTLSQRSVLSFDAAIGKDSQATLELETTDIKDPANFIASCIRRVGAGDKYRTVTVDGIKKSKAIILSDEEIAKLSAPKTKSIWILQVGNRKIAFDTPTTKLSNQLVIGKEEPEPVPVEELGGKEVKVPSDGKYCKEPVINRIFSANHVPLENNIDKNALLKAIRKQNKSKTDWNFYFYNRSIVSATHSRAILVTKKMVEG